jgi:hypothetical protein
LARDIKFSFGYYVPIFVDYKYAKNGPSEQEGSREMSIGAKWVKIRICRKKIRFLAVFYVTLL